MTGLVVSLKMSLPGFTLDTDWVVRDGFTVLFGYSGSGKSLTLAAIAGTLRPDAGCIRLAGRTLFDSSTGVWVPPQQRKISYVPQSAHLFPHMTLRRNVAFALKGVGRVERECRVEDVLERLHITRLAEKLPHQLSGGQRQRGALARALVGEPAALLLDEPLSALDLPTRVEMREVLRDVQLDTEIPVIMVTHDLLEACALAETLVAYGGTGAVQVGSPRELVANPSTPEIRRLLNAMEVPASTFRDTRRRAGVVVPLIRGEQRAARRAL
ncbi:MAG: ABC transporter ATP-binding protein [Coriobacteriia bacterium]